MNIGDNIKSQRLKRRLTLTELSLKSGVQLATLSRIENNKMSGTVKSHKSIAQAMGIDITDLFKGKKIEQGNIETMEVKGISDLSIKDASDKRMKPQFFCLHEGAETHEVMNSPKEKIIYVLDGKIEIDSNGEKYILKKESTFHSNHYLGSSIKNIGQTKARFLTIEYRI